MLLNTTNTGNETTSDPAVTWTKIVLILGFGTPLELVGLFTSILTFVMFFYDRFTPKTTKHLLQFISVMDALLLFFGLGYLNVKSAYLAMPKKSKWRFYIQKFYSSYQPIFYIFLNWCEMTRNWTVVLVGIERCMVTCKPLQAYRLWTIKRTHMAIIFVCIMSGVLRIPVILLEFFKKSKKYEEYEKKARFLHNGSDCIFLGIVPILLLGFCSISIIRVLRFTKILNGHQSNGHGVSNSAKSQEVTYAEHNENRQNPSKQVSRFHIFSNFKANAKGLQSQKRYNVSLVEGNTDGSYNHYSVYTGPGDHYKLPESRVTSAKTEIRRRRLKVTRMLIFVFVLFVLLGVPSMIHWVLLCLESEHSIVPIMSAVHWFISLSYSTSNFFVYIAYMPKYREILRYLLCIKTCRVFKKDNVESNKLLSRHLYNKPTCFTFTCTCHQFCTKRALKRALLRTCCCFFSASKQYSIRGGKNGHTMHDRTLPRAPKHLHRYKKSKNLNFDNSFSTSEKNSLNNRYYGMTYKARELPEYNSLDIKCINSTGNMNHLCTNKKDYMTNVRNNDFIHNKTMCKFTNLVPEYSSAAELSCASATLPCVAPCPCQFHHYLHHHQIHYAHFMPHFCDNNLSEKVSSSLKNSTNLHTVTCQHMRDEHISCSSQPRSCCHKNSGDANDNQQITNIDDKPSTSDSHTSELPKESHKSIPNDEKT